MFLMFLMFPVHNTQKPKPHHYNKYKNTYTNFISISITKKNKYNKTVQCPTTKQYNVPQQQKMNKNTKWTKTQQNKKNTKQNNNKNKKTLNKKTKKPPKTPKNPKKHTEDSK